MNIYKIAIKDNTVVSTEITNHLEHGDIGINPVDKTLQWLALECEDEQVAIEIAESVINSVWKHDTGINSFLMLK